MVSDEGEHLALRQILVELLAAEHLPAGYAFRDFVQAGGLMSYSVDLTDMFRLIASQAADILRGKKPADIPIYSQPSTSGDQCNDSKGAGPRTVTIIPCPGGSGD
ncbi:hypothetical protein [Bradyrhizobium sp. MOS003]|uniref:hypothetical protein n=1 Tax=Bradyrhizobium sp. MOS003 TaxID=2133946 RepID=UPI0011BFC1FC|nr:hypothetical protein [Bradyrhizobium sp. MOS003]